MKTKEKSKEPAKSGFQKVLDLNLANVVKKVQAGKTLTPNELALIEARKDGRKPLPAKAKNKTELARILEVSRQRLQNWTGRPDFPKPEDDRKWNVTACRDWAAIYSDSDSGSIINEKVERARIAKIRADRAQIALDKERGQLIDADEVKRIWTVAMTEHKRRAFALPAKLALELAVITNSRVTSSQGRSTGPRSIDS